MLDCGETYLPGKLVIGTVGEGVFDATLADFLPFYLEGTLQSLDAFLVYYYWCDKIALV